MSPGPKVIPKVNAVLSLLEIGTLKANQLEDANVDPEGTAAIQ